MSVSFSGTITQLQLLCSLWFLLLETQGLCGIVHVAVSQLACVAPARPGIKTENEGPVYLGFLAVETCSHKTVYFFGQQNLLLQSHVVVLDDEARCRG